MSDTELHMKTLRIVTYNFLSGGSARRATHWQQLHAQLQPDVLLTQECKDDLPRRQFRHKTRLWSEARARRWGTGMYARRLVAERVDVARFRGWITGGEVGAIAGLTTRPIRMFSVHCPPGQHGYVRTMHDMIDRFRKLGKTADLVLGGDFNIAVGFRGPDEAVKVSKAERDVLTRITTELDLIPCWQTANPDRPLAQTLRWTGNRAAPYHCDGIFIPRAWQPRLVSCEVLSGPVWDALSDHNPVQATIAVE